MKSSAKNVKLASVDDLFSTEESRADEQREKVVEIPLTELHPFKNHPFKVKDDEAMMDTAESIRQYGVLVPAIARPDPNGGYELVAGHRRHHASEIAGKETMPVIVRDLDDDAATIIMVDSNLQREELLPSERAFAYKMKLEAMKRQAGRPSKENCSQVGNDFGKKSSEILAEQVGQSKNQIFRFIRLTELIPPLLDMVDEKKIALSPAYELSFLKPEEQAQLVETMDYEQATPSLSQAQRLKKFSQEGKLTEEVMLAIMSEEKKGELDRVTLTSETLRMLLHSLECSDDAGIAAVKKDIPTMEATLKKLSQQEEKYTAELNDALRQYADLKEQTAEFDPEELQDARCALRPAMERSAVDCVQSAYGNKYDPLMMYDSKRDVANLLHEEAEERSIRERLRQKQQQKTKQKQDKKKSRDSWER